MKLLDYMFYRIYGYYKAKRDSIPVVMGCLILAVLTYFTILSIDSIISVLFKTPLGIVVEKYVVLIIFLSALYLLWNRYGNSNYVVVLEQRYKNEAPSEKKRKGWLVFLYIVLMLFIPMSLGFMRHNLGMNI